MNHPLILALHLGVLVDQGDLAHRIILMDRVNQFVGFVIQIAILVVYLAFFHDLVILRVGRPGLQDHQAQISW